jgi:hypothetical protein
MRDSSIADFPETGLFSAEAVISVPGSHPHPACVYSSFFLHMKPSLNILLCGIARAFLFI